jgi:hypothetical protein
MVQLIRHAVLLCNGQTTDHFNKPLNRVESIEIPYLDMRRDDLYGGGFRKGGCNAQRLLDK